MGIYGWVWNYTYLNLNPNPKLLSMPNSKPDGYAFLISKPETDRVLAVHTLENNDFLHLFLSWLLGMISWVKKNEIKFFCLAAEKLKRPENLYLQPYFPATIKLI